MSSFQGLSGYFYLPYEYFKNSNLINIMGGAWTIHHVGIRPEHLLKDGRAKMYHRPAVPSPLINARLAPAHQSVQLLRRYANVHPIRSYGHLALL